MGQGEPFLNYDNFMKAVRLLVEGVGIPESRMTVSTSGIVPRISDFGGGGRAAQAGDFAERVQRRHAHRRSCQSRKWTLEKLMAALREFPLRNREKLTFEYVLLGRRQ